MVKSKTVAAIDVGSSKIAVIAGRLNSEGRIEVLGVHAAPSAGVRRGAVLNIEEASRAIDNCLSQLERQIDDKIEEVYVNIVGQQMKTYTLRGEKYIGKDKLVTQQDVDFLIQEALQTKIDPLYKIYHIEPQLYSVDQEGSCFDPVGMRAEKLTVEFKLIIGLREYEDNLKQCFRSLGIVVKGAILDPLASSDILLTEDEKETGVILLDIGAGTSKLTIYHEGLLRYSTVIPFGGNVLSNDIKEGCAIGLRAAESLKTQYGQAMGKFAPEDKVVTIPSQSGWEPKEISFQNLAFIIQARMEEIIDNFVFHIERSGYAENIGSGIVLTGGTGLLQNLNQLLKYKTTCDVRLGVPYLKLERPWKGLDDPHFATMLGLLKIGLRHEGPDMSVTEKPKKQPREKSQSFGLLKKMKENVARQMDIFFNDEQGIEMK